MHSAKEKRRPGKGRRYNLPCRKDVASPYSNLAQFASVDGGNAKQEIVSGGSMANVISFCEFAVRDQRRREQLAVEDKRNKMQSERCERLRKILGYEEWPPSGGRAA